MLFVVIIGCGGGGGGAGSGPLTRYVGTWFGTMIGSDGSERLMSLAISNTGSISGYIDASDVNAPPYFTETGTINSSGVFSITALSTGLPDIVVTGQLEQSGMLDSTSTSNGCCSPDYLNGSGVMTYGSTRAKVTLSFQFQ